MGDDMLLEDALIALAARDGDHAMIQNGEGFNGRDTEFGNSLASQVMAGRSLTFKQRRAAYRMLRTYRTQLLRYGIDYDSIPEPRGPKPARDREEAVPAAPRPDITATVQVIEGIAVLDSTGYDPTIVAWAKSMPGRTYDPKTKRWKWPLSPATVLRMATPPPRVTLFNPEAIMRFEAQMELNRNASYATDAELEVPGLGGELFPFQKAGVDYVVHNRRTFIADEMGLGKTVQAIASCLVLDAFPAVVVAPAVVKLNWKREIERWAPGRTIELLNGRKPTALEPADFYVVNYDVLASWLAELQNRKPAAIILDESHYVKNGKSLRTKAARDLAQGIPVRMLLSGTPVLNRPAELISQLQVAGLMAQFGTRRAFVDRYCDPVMTSWGEDISGASNLDELHHRLRSMGYIRRTKTQVLSELPAKRRAVVPLELSDRTRYEETLSSLRRWCRERVDRDEELRELFDQLDPEDRERAADAFAARKEARAMMAEALTRMEALKQVAAEEKLEAAIAWMKDFLASGEKLVVFATHQNIIAKVKDELGCASITGATPMVARQAAVDAFQTDDDVKAIVLNIQAGGVGITLHAASNVVFLELPWRPGDLDQAEDRLHRIGQTDSVTAWYLLAANTVDESIARLLHHKRSVVDATTDGLELEADASLVTQLMKALLEEER